jgi:uncharacterized protein (UPF0548 family)
MFLSHRPSPRVIEEFLASSQSLPLSYPEVGIARDSPPGFKLDQTSRTIGHGPSAFDLAKEALSEWRHFHLGWVELFPRRSSIEPGTVVAVLVNHLGFWSINGCRVLYGLGDSSSNTFGFAYGTLTNHAEMGEEIFEVSLTPESSEVVYTIRAVSKPRATLAWLGYPLARHLQARFRRDSIAAMEWALSTR